MTRILIFSDSHGRSDVMHSELQKHQVDRVIHCGDFARDLKGESHWRVHGNCDSFSRFPGEIQQTLEGRNLLILHGHRQGVKNGLLRLHYYARQQSADVVFFGHTHRPLATQKDGIWFFNPGSISLPAAGYAPSYLQVDIHSGQVDYQFHFLK